MESIVIAVGGQVNGPMEHWCLAAPWRSCAVRMTDRS